MKPIVFPLKPQMKRPEVADLHAVLKLLDLTISDAETTNHRYGASTRTAVVEFQRAHDLPETGEVDEATANAINVVLEDNGALEPRPGGDDLPAPDQPPEEQLYGVQGEVVKPDGTPLPRLIVRAYDRALCDWRLLGGDNGAASTDDRGRYVIAYDPAQLKQWGKTRADLKIEVHDATGDVKLAESPLILQALPREVINFSIGEDRYRGLDEYTRLERALAPMIGSLNDLDCLEVADVLILAREADLPGSNVAYYIKAQRWSTEYGLPAKLFYGLMRTGESTRIDALLARPLARIWARLTEAKSDNLIDLPLTGETRDKLAELQQTYLSRPGHPYARLLETTALSSKQRTVFTRALTSGVLTGDKFWQSLETEADFSPEAVADVRATFEVQAFTGDNTSLAVRLRGDLGVRQPREVAAFSVEQWRDDVLGSAAVEIPDDMLPNLTPEQRRAGYATMLYRAAELNYPTPSLVGQLTRDPLPGQDSLLSFFTKNPTFEFRDQRVLSFLREHPKALDGHGDSARDDLLRVEQLFHLAPEVDKLAAIKPLWESGLRSAPQVAYLGRGNLARRLGSSIDAKAAHQIYRKAVHVTSLALNVYLRYHPRLNNLSMTALRMPQLQASQSTSKALASAAISMPEWEELFGSPDACECSSCESALSPAAYLLDTMSTLTRAVDANGNNALDELLNRRPDLGTLRLTCENTETLVPNIDLAIEVLEAIVASPDGKTLPGASIGETTWESDLLDAQPEHLLPAAYDVVRQSRYPFNTLPFDLWAEEGRRYLSQMGIARDELMRVMPAKPDVGPLDTATEALGMSSLERELICQPKERPAELAPNWGIDLSRGTLTKQLGSVEALIEQALIDYDTLLRLLNTRYINPDRSIVVDFGETPCSLDNATLADGDGVVLADAPFRAFLDRLHRFLRLQRRLGCSEYELDGLIHALGVADFNAANFLQNIAAARALRDTLGLSLHELSAWWVDLDVWAFEDELPSQYEAIFLDAKLFPDTYAGVGPDLRNDVFALRADRADLAITTSTEASLSPWLAESDGAVPPNYTLQPDYAAYIQSATRLTVEDLLLLVQEILPKDATTGHVALNLANASLIYRVSSLARALDTAVIDALRLFAITGVTPVRTSLASPGPTESQRFHERFDEIDGGAYSIEELAYLLLNEPSAASVLAPTDADLDAWLAAVSPSFTGILAADDDRLTDELKASVTQSLGTTLNADPATFDALLFTHRPNIGDDLLKHLIVAGNLGAPSLPAPRAEFSALFGQLQKFGLAWNGLALDQSFLAFVLDQGPDLGWFDIAAFPMTPQSSAEHERWRRLVAAADLQASAFTLELSLFDLLEDAAAQTSDPSSFVLSDFLAMISDWTGWSLPDVPYLTGPNGFNLTLPDAMQDERALVALERVFDLIRVKGIAAEQAHAWTIAELTYVEAQAIKQALSLSYQPEQWLDVLGSIQDELRTLKRDALLGHVLTTLGMEDSDEFYRYYLIDVDESPYDRTSRIVLAHSAVQLFAQRILLNLEPFTFERQDAEEWQWRKKYRVWEAARKIFLRPENWLEPELRDNKSFAFKEFEEGLLQDDVTHQTAERLYLEYLHKVDDVSNLEIMGMYREDETDEHPAVLHVFGRTGDMSRRYYYRRWEDEARWTPWESVELGIDADHLIPIVSNGRLYLFWPEITDADNPDAGEPIEKTVALSQGRIDDINAQIAAHERRIREINDELEMLPPHKADVMAEYISALETERTGHEQGIADLEDILETGTEIQIEYGERYIREIGMKWSEYRDGRWLSTSASKDKLSFKTNYGQQLLYFTGWIAEDNVLRISVRLSLEFSGLGVDDARSSEGYIGYFYFDNCGRELVKSDVEVTDPTGDVRVVLGLASFHHATLFSGHESLELEIGDVPEKRVLINPTSGRLYYAHQDGKYGKETSPFFFSDDTRTYFVTFVDDYFGPGDVLDYYTGFETTTTLRRTNGKVAPAAIASGISSQPTASSTTLTSMATNQHFGASDTGLIMSRGELNTINSSLLNQIGATIAVDSEPGAVASYNEVALITQRYQFTRFYHPYTCLFLKQCYRYGIDGLLNPDPALGGDFAELYRQMTPSESFDFEATYQPNLGWVDDNFNSDQLDEVIDFDHWSPDGGINWELFFHIPLLVATRLMQNQRYSEARRWFHYIFDPMVTDGAGPERFWKFKPFYEEQLNGPLDSLESLLTEGNQSYEQQIQEWEADPFQPHVIARLRTTSYMQAVVMRYLDCLINEADMLFQRNTREDIYEARQLYLLAAVILGDRPEMLPAQESSSLTPDLLLKRFRIDWNGLPGIDPLGQLISYLPTSLSGAVPGRMSSMGGYGAITVDGSPLGGFGGFPTGTLTQVGVSSVDTLLLFCLPHNDMLYAYWDRVADRLFKIRHSMTLAGEVRQLALLAPPIDPALLVRASAAGLSIEEILSSVFAPRSHYRFSFLLQKALEMCGEARGFGGALLSTLEKQDGEELAALRGSHEVALLESIRALKLKSLDEAEASLASLVKNRESAELRASYYAGLERISTGEQNSLDLQEEAAKIQRGSDTTSALASILYQVPNVTVEVGVPPSVGTQFGGVNLGGSTQAIATAERARSAFRSFEASKSGTMASYDRRFKDWGLQADLAHKEIEQLDKQIIAAEIRKQIAETDLKNHDQQITQAREIEEFLSLKFTNQQLYSSMVSKLATVHYQAYRMAYQLAMQAQAAFQQELGPDEQSLIFIKPDNWDSLKKGLLAGELLHQQLRQMETAFLSVNKRELEITKHVSLFQLDPEELLKLRQTGSCEFHLPEVLYNMDFAGHYYRRIKAVRLTIPCVVGPYTNVSVTLRLNNSWTRRNTDFSDAGQPAADMVDAPQAAIAITTANQDGGTFELNFNDPRYLPFEGAGAISSWSLELPASIRPFDYATIADAVMHVSYTARDGGPELKAAVSSNLIEALNDLQALLGADATMSRLFSLRHEFPSAWSQLVSANGADERTCTLRLSKAHFPGFLDFEWQPSTNGALEAHPITLDVTRLTGFLSPHGPLPEYAQDIEVNQQPASTTDLNMPMFNLTNAPDALSSASIGNADTVTCTLTLTGTLQPQDWSDLYLLMNYDVRV